jgi:hypothetical protein
VVRRGRESGRWKVDLVEIANAVSVVLIIIRTLGAPKHTRVHPLDFPTKIISTHRYQLISAFLLTITSISLISPSNLPLYLL